MQIKQQYKILLLALLVITIPNLASAVTIEVRDSTTGALLNSTINTTYNQYNSYQETATIATSTGGLSTGSYYTTYETLVNGTTNQGYLYVNYSKTAVSANATWQVKYGLDTANQPQNITNYTISTNCYNAYSDKIVLRFVTRYSAGSGYSYGQCYNTTNWTGVTNGSSYAGINLPVSGFETDDIRWYDANYSSSTLFASGGLDVFKNSTSAALVGIGAAGVSEEAIYWLHPYQQVLLTAPGGTTTLSNASYYLVANLTASSGGYGSVTITNLNLSSASTYVINLTTSNNVTFRVVDETTGAIINTTNVQLSSTLYGTNATTTAGTVTFYNLTYGLYTITYNASGYSQRSYNILLPTTTSETVVLYLLSSTLSTTVRFTVADTTNFRLTNATVYLQKKNSSGTNYYLVATCTTDTNGQCVSNVNIIDTTYRFLVYYNGAFRADSLDTTVTSTEVAIPVSLLGDPLDEYFAIPNIATGLTYTGGTGTWTVADASGNVQQGCVRLYRRTGFINTELNGSCATGSVFTVSAYANNSLGDENYAIGTIYINGQQYEIDRISEDNNDLAGASNTGLVLLAVVFAVGITLSFKYSWDMTTAVVMFMATTTLFWSVGLIQISSFALISGLILLMVFLVRNKQ